MKVSSEDLPHIIEKAKSGQQIAFSKLLESFWDDVYRFQLSRSNNEVDAEDITIQTFSRAFDKIGSYNPSYDFKNWLLTISKNLHVDLIRKQKKEITEGLKGKGSDAAKKVLDETPTAEDNLIIEQNLASLLADIKKLKKGYQEVINLRYFNEMSYDQIATQLGEPLNNVKVKLLRAKKLLAEIIKAK
ncbi:RNA polymerase sigma factor [Croceivirga thetidis]|uniref:Sigma-70 family RNA polymerase sigma factor n=1 Tax=Croceivirga thetidis TaxID=2721623 RepID=A0ABX1GWJ9_9FLAO|nr:sigma-70 family RNA polymerase sigma factor [Croceivirga thetidis]NKI33340.1 sigma-70 family RNA polymerase sigma factor [Croceivirga thetidis]